jgi:selenocysteine lyase/cysteine desulfurase
LVLLDAAQWAGHFSQDLFRAGVDLVAFTGHKGLLGPQGIGGLWVREGLDLAPTLFGGTGGTSNLRTMPDAFPDRLEAGSGNAPGMAGLLAGVTYLEAEGVERIHAREMALKDRLWTGLHAIENLRVLSPKGEDGVAIVTVISDRISPPDLARALDRDWGVLVRHGLNCAPEVHRILGTSRTGAVRFSLGWATTEVDVERAIEAVESIMAGSTRTDS